jgi:hypothetical protein
MADRTVYGRTHSENGWRMVDQGSCRHVLIPGTNVRIWLREGQPEKILGAFAADFNAYVEPLRQEDSGGWTATNDVASSNHLSGTAMDLNWQGPNKSRFRLGITEQQAYPPPKDARLRELITFYEGMVFCGGNWSIRDWMHFQMGGNTYGSQHVAKVNDFIARKIRPDGFSTFHRSGSTPSTPTVTYWAEEGHSGEHVKRLQQFLNARGAGLAVDGDFGPLTKAAVQAFQRDSSIDADGIVGPITLGKLKDAGFNPDGTPAPPPVKRFPQDFSDRELLEYIAEQLGPGHPDWKSKGMTLRDKVWSL